MCESFFRCSRSTVEVRRLSLHAYAHGIVRVDVCRPMPANGVQVLGNTFTVHEFVTCLLNLLLRRYSVLHGLSSCQYGLVARKAAPTAGRLVYSIMS